jgi:selenocysteine lyase/cysteine desulfurase
MIGVRLPGGLPNGLAERLAAAQVHVSLRGDSIRVAPHLYNDERDVTRLVEVLRSVI